MLANIQKLSNIKDNDREIHKTCTVRRALPGRIPGGWRYFGWALFRMGVISDGRYFGWALFRMGVISDGRYFGWALFRMGVISDGRYFGWALFRMGVISDGHYFGRALLSKQHTGCRDSNSKKIVKYLCKRGFGSLAFLDPL